MCLVKSEVYEPTDTVYHGYKVFERYRNNKLYGFYRCITGDGTAFEADKWYAANRYWSSWERGYHIYKSKAAAKKLAKMFNFGREVPEVWRVQYKQRIAKGADEFGVAVQAHQMKLIEKVEV